eukprot:5173845-Pleurochrysis_carterae.AAC.1
MPTGEGAHGAPSAYSQELRALMCERALDATFAAVAPRCRAATSNGGEGVSGHAGGCVWTAGQPG